MEPPILPEVSSSKALALPEPSHTGYRRLYPMMPQFLLALAAFSIIAYNLGTASLFETSEGRFASVSRSMLDSGDWITPRLNGIAHFTKPPLTYWASAVGMKLFGINEFAAKCFLPFTAALTVIGCYQIGILLMSTKAALSAAFALLTSLFFIEQFKGLTCDPLLALFETWMVWALIRYHQRPGKRTAVMFWAFAGLGMLTKGPPALIPLLGILPAFWLCKNLKGLKKLLSNKIGWIYFSIIGLGWFLLVIFLNTDLLKYFIVDETINRFTSQVFHRNGSWHYFIWVLLVGTFPWTPFFIGGIIKAYREYRTNHDFSSCLLILWLFIPFIFFSLSASKRTAYILPLLIPACLLTGKYIGRMLNFDEDEPFAYKLESAITLIFMALVAVALIFCSLSGVIIDLKIAKLGILLAGYFLFLATFGYYFMRLGIAKGIVMILGITVPGAMVFILPAIFGGEEVIKERYIPGYRELLRYVATLPANTPLVCIEEMLESIPFYTGRIIPTWNVSRESRIDPKSAEILDLHGGDALQRIATEGLHLLIRKRDLESVKKIIGEYIVSKKIQGEWGLYTLEKVVFPPIAASKTADLQTPSGITPDKPATETTQPSLEASPSKEIPKPENSLPSELSADGTASISSKTTLGKEPASFSLKIDTLPTNTDLKPETKPQPKNGKIATSTTAIKPAPAKTKPKPKLKPEIKPPTGKAKFSTDKQVADKKKP